MDLGLTNRVMIVTGGTRGLGRAAAEALVAEGARVVVSSRDPASVQHAAAALGGEGRAVGVMADNADPLAADLLVEAALSTYGRLDGALISVGGPPAGAALAVTDEQWSAAFASIFLGAVRTARTVAGVLEPGGVLGFVLSTSVKAPVAGLALSNGLRPGLAMIAKTLADELGPRGVRVVSLLPGAIATERMTELDPSGAGRREREAGIPLRRYGEPGEFGRVAAFLLSPAASYLSGCAVPVDGGSTRAL